MSNYPPEYCPYCGSELDAVRATTVFRCASCTEQVFHNPVPQARVAVVDDDRLLLAKIPTDEESLWSIPGGTIEVDEEAGLPGLEDAHDRPPVGCSRYGLFCTGTYRIRVVPGEGSEPSISACPRNETQATPRDIAGAAS